MLLVEISAHGALESDVILVLPAWRGAYVVHGAVCN
jgi:hypothetical protein